MQEDIYQKWHLSLFHAEACAQQMLVIQVLAKSGQTHEPPVIIF